ncbi:PAS domain S-box-containing protein [Nonomuraea maritima]|uniref:protein-serine/threonine phosphatase n=1 Tax=Nonomuraea maritima TaxID=683260 RepID=A0A1G9LI03_9ACTN|nr:SpoIIE family protein phosphatase [Nonomuraea maritima]SDL61413.1 PAS domain S-box-containing protein [Nonomuraea maritima]
MENVHDRSVHGPMFEVFDPVPLAITVTRGPEHRLVYHNPRYTELFGDRPLGVPIRKAFAELGDEECFGLFDEVYRTGEPVVRADVPGSESLAHVEPSERYFTFSLSRIVFSDGTYGVLAVLMEVTEQVTVSRQLQEVADERRRILHRYHCLMRVSADIFWVTDPKGRVIVPSPGWERVTGQTWEEYRGEGWVETLHPDDRTATVEAWGRALNEPVQPWERVYRLRTEPGEYRHFLARGVPVREQGRVVEWVGTATDIEDHWQAQRRRRLLDAAAAATGDLTSVEEMLNALANVIVPELADGCAFHWVIDLSEDLSRGGDFLLERVAVVVRPGLLQLPPFSEERHPPDGRLARSIRRRKPFLKTFPPGEPPPDLVPKGTRAWLEETRGHCVALVPIVVDGTVAAVLSASVCGDRAPISPGDLALLRELIDQMHDRLNSAMRFQRTHRIALALQHSLLADPPKLPGLQITARYRASPTAAEVGGDWYDSFVLPDGATVLAIGDVAGHDLRATVTMGQLRNMLRGLVVDRQEPPGHILGRLNTAMKTLYAEETATCVLARVEQTGDGGHELYYAVAGHPPPLLVTRDGEARFLEAAPNPLLGIPYDEPCTSAREPLPPGSTLLLYTDGLVERPTEHLDKGFERLRARAAALHRAPLDRFCDDLLSYLPRKTDDDVAMIALRLPAG